MQKLLKNKTFIGCAAAALLVILAVVLILLLPRGGEKPAGEPSSPPPQVVVSVPDDGSVGSAETTSGTSHAPDSSDAPPSDTGKPDGGSGKAEEGAKPVKPVAPEQPNNSGGVQIGNADGAAEKYSCGSPNHHCEGPETHAYIQNLELEGCPYCGSHTCRSFYGTDEWGNGGFFPDRCSKYLAQDDPALYCQKCKRKKGDGRNGTCVQYVEACACPGCGRQAESWTCHRCE